MAKIVIGNSREFPSAELTTIINAARIISYICEQIITNGYISEQININGYITEQTNTEGHIN